MNIQVVIVCLYGILHGTREDVELQGYHEYLKAVAHQIIELAREGRVIVVLCGGYTNTNVPTLSEAASVYDFIMEHIKLETRCDPLEIEPKFIIQDDSFNSPQNILFGAEIARDNLGLKDWDAARITVIADTVRFWKTIILSWLILIRKMKLRNKWTVKVFDREDVHFDSKWWKQVRNAFKYLVHPNKLTRELAAASPRDK